MLSPKNNVMSERLLIQIIFEINSKLTTNGYFCVYFLGVTLGIG